MIMCIFPVKTAILPKSETATEPLVGGWLDRNAHDASRGNHGLGKRSGGEIQSAKLRNCVSGFHYSMI